MSEEGWAKAQPSVEHAVEDRRGGGKVLALKRRCAISCNKLLEALATPKPLGWPGCFEIQISLGAPARALC